MHEKFVKLCKTKVNTNVGARSVLSLSAALLSAPPLLNAAASIPAPSTPDVP